MSLHIFARSTITADLYPIELSLDATVDDLRNALEDALKVTSVQITYQGQPCAVGSATLADLGVCPESVVDVTCGKLEIARWGRGLDVGEDKQTVSDKEGATGCAVAREGWDTGKHTWYVDIVNEHVLDRSDRCYDIGVCTDSADLDECPLHNRIGVYSVRGFGRYLGNCESNPARFEEGDVAGWPTSMHRTRVTLTLDCDKQELCTSLQTGHVVIVRNLPRAVLYPCVGFQSCSVMLRMHNNPDQPMP
eukprot:TRINITY_DN3833_c0_g2_i3.p1 TRINITY_DN3833_c0_g2~~TRINITY_DN3833_c0_g2_i3.p1  ORF type:complete len:249 (+),score=35.94 TRINITY_DN3833_c0_g2_i3:48-794(+)